MEAKAVLDASGSSSALCSIALGYECLDEFTELPLFVEPVECHFYKYPSNGAIAYLISRCFPESMTQVMSGMVIPVSAILVAALSP